MLNVDSNKHRIVPITITRDGLMRVFDSLSNQRIIYVEAPAGSGKTVAVRQWIDKSAAAKAVISLDEYDDDIIRFCESFCEALRLCQPKNAALDKIVSHPAFKNAPDEFSVRAISALTKREEAILVIDDLHFIQNRKLLRLISVLLKRLPKSFQIILISRSNLPDVFSDLWLNGYLVRITAEHLRFSSEEIAMMYKERGNPISAKQADNIYRFAEGWAIGVNALCLSGGEPSGEIMSYLDDFLQNNIWEQWDEDTREFMLRTAIARELTPPLCAKLTGMANCDDILNRLMMQNVFISRINSSTYKYHQLFQNFLMRMVKNRGDSFIRKQWEKAGNFYLSQNSFYDAVDCFIKCENHDGIAKGFGLLAESGYEYLHIDKLITVANESVVEKVAEKYPVIYSTLMWAAFNEGRDCDMMRYADLYYKNQPEIARLDPRLKFSIILAWFIDFRIPLGRLALISEKILADFKGVEFGEMGISLGIINQNMPLLHRGTRDFSECVVGDTEANIEKAKFVLSCLLGKGSVLLAECLAAGITYELGQLEKAYRYAIAANAQIGIRSSPEAKFFAMSTLVYVLYALGEKEQAEHIMTRIGEMIEKDSAYYLSANFNALAVRYKLGRGDLAAAKEWLETHKAAFWEDMHFYNIYETFTTCRAYIAVGDYDSAIILLKKLLQLAGTYRRPLDIIETEILLAIAYWGKKSRFQDEAVRHLESAASLAYKYKFTQIFINDSAELTGMLRRLQKRAEQSENKEELPSSFIKMLYLNTLEHQEGGLTSGLPERIYKYTEKQKTVMKLLCEGKSYREIAEIMKVKLPTLRSHIALIYKKLDVTSESDAIIKIKAKNILEEG